MPPPPPGPPPPPAPPPAAAAAAPKFKLKSKGGDAAFGDFIQNQMEEVAEIIPVRPKTPPPRPPDVEVDVTILWVGTTELYNQVQFGANLLVIDVRDEEAFKEGHVRSAVNVPLSTVAGRPLNEVEGELPPRFFRRRTDTVFVYDEGSAEGDAGEAAEFLKLLAADRLAQQPVRVVAGGFKRFAARFPFLDTGSEVFKSIEYALEYPSMVEEDFLFLGNWASAKSKEVVCDHLKITHVVNASAVCPHPFEGEPHNIKYFQVPIDDAPGSDIKTFFDDTLAFMDDAASRPAGRVLVHCQMGMSRSSTLVLLWLMMRRDKNLRDAFRQTRFHRPYINPNPGFMLQLGKFEEEVKGASTIRFPKDEPVTLRTVYEWHEADGSWTPRKVVGYDDAAAGDGGGD
mmetsp:Transcript_35660/g.93215  ORF Transcript_35660/g.93215 Transcript_35660/m.93215 type:complete len:399 (-) Transcript_35660:93-1289(-)